jgi:hypothetical protein
LTIKISFRFPAKLSTEYREFLHVFYPHTPTTSPAINISHQSRTVVIIDEFALTLGVIIIAPSPQFIFKFPWDNTCYEF